MMHERHPLVGRRLASRNNSRLAIEAAPDCARFVLRIGVAHLSDASKAFGCPLASTIGQSECEQEHISVCLGPDEWYLMALNETLPAIEESFSALSDLGPHGVAGIAHSLVDVSHREVGIEISGPAAALALQSSIAFDVQAMLVGSGCRTIFDKAQIILLRRAEDCFRIEVWRSFASHVWGILEAVAHEIELDI